MIYIYNIFYNYDYWEDLWALREKLIRSQYSKMPMRQELLGLVSFGFLSDGLELSC